MEGDFGEAGFKIVTGGLLWLPGQLNYLTTRMNESYLVFQRIKALGDDMLPGPLYVRKSWEEQRILSQLGWCAVLDVFRICSLAYYTAWKFVELDGEFEI